MKLDRRSFLHLSSLAAGGLLLSIFDESLIASTDLTNKGLQPNAWLRIDANNRITFILDKVEMGQSVYTSLATLVAEELEVELEQLNIEMAPVDRVYINKEVAGIQVTGGSSSISGSYEKLRIAGASCRQLLLEAAAKRWQLPISSLKAQAGRISHIETGRSLSFGELAFEAAQLPIPKDVTLKQPKDFRLIGKSRARLDAPIKVKGEAIFGIDVKLPDLRIAVHVKPPQKGAILKSFDATAAKSVAGVEDVLPVGGGIAVIALRYWQARKAAELLKIEWQPASGKAMNSSEIYAEFSAAAQKSLKSLIDDRAADTSHEKKTVRASYQIPYLAHATMEPMNCTVRIQNDHCEIWAPTQGPDLAQQIAHEVSGIKLANIVVHTTFLGGGFGRRLYQDFIGDAVMIAQAAKKPIKLIWSREEDMQRDYYRPACVHEIESTVGSDGLLHSWHHAVVGPSILSKTLPPWAPTILPPWLPDIASKAAGWGIETLMTMSKKDPSSVEGIEDTPYAIAELKLAYEPMDPGLPVGFWRSVGHSYSGFIVETMIDELAHQAGLDPIIFRRKNLAHKPRQLAVLDALAQHSGWATPLATGRFRGLALHESFGSVCGQVAELRVDEREKRIVIERVVAVIDCGRVIHPNHVEAQIAGAIIFGLSAALHGEITIKDNQVEQSNFHDYPVLRLAECPKIEVHSLVNSDPPHGVGEPGVPPIAAAVANALFAATGQRHRRLPLRPLWPS